MYGLVRRLLFLLNPEVAHSVTLQILRYLPKFFFKKIPAAPVEVFGLTFPNFLGLAAGLDKNGDYIDALAKLGFGFIEVGTVTPRAQPGNPKPRLFRLPQKQALINRMGFNNKGVDYLIAQLQKIKYRGILGINIGKNFDTPEEQATQDYLTCLEKVYRYASYITINVSSPNTPGLRKLQHGEQLAQLLQQLTTRRTELAAQHNKTVPLLVKLAPDLTTEEVQQIAATLLKYPINGVIACNTSFSRAGVEGLPHADEAGGLSGAPIREQATKVISLLKQALGDKLPIIGVGGIMNAADVQEKLQAGASLVQIYTGLIYQGPNLRKFV